MDSQYIGSLLAFAIVTTITPGPNNLMLAASGLNYGFYKTLPHLFGIVAGCLCLFVAVASGLGAVFMRFPLAQTILKVVGAVYLMWLAWRIATASRTKVEKKGAKPMTLFQAFLFQWVNPKAWTMSLTAISAFSLEGNLLVLSLGVIVIAFGLVSFPCCTCWILLGSRIASYLRSDRSLAWFNRTLGGLTALSVLLIVN